MVSKKFPLRLENPTRTLVHKVLTLNTHHNSFREMPDSYRLFFRENEPLAEYLQQITRQEGSVVSSETLFPPNHDWSELRSQIENCFYFQNENQPIVIGTYVHPFSRKDTVINIFLAQKKGFRIKNLQRFDPVSTRDAFKCEQLGVDFFERQGGRIAQIRHTPQLDSNIIETQSVDKKMRYCIKDVSN